MTYGPRLIWLGFASLIASACSDEVPCFTKGAEKDRTGVCNCAAGMHPEGSGDGECVSDDVSSASAADGGTGSLGDGGFRRDAAGQDTGPVDSAVPADDASKPDPMLACVPSSELCDGKDNDCDDFIDEDVTDSWVGQSCSSGGQGACDLPGTYGCVAGAKVCSAPSAMPIPEICDGKDNDCKDGVDNGFVTGAACSVGTGECKASGTLQCDKAGGVSCLAVEKAASAEVCGDGKDNDCNGKIDDAKNECGMPCGATCPPVCVPTSEVCGDGKDNDCDGAIDESDVCAPVVTSVCGDGKISGTEACDIKLTNDWHCAANCSSVRGTVTAYTACDPANPKCGFGEGCSPGLGSKNMCFPYKAKVGVGTCAEIIKAPFVPANGSSSLEMCVIGCQNTGTVCPNHLACSVLPNGNGTCVLP